MFFGDGNTQSWNFEKEGASQKEKGDEEKSTEISIGTTS